MLQLTICITESAVIIPTILWFLFTKFIKKKFRNSLFININFDKIAECAYKTYRYAY